jgi:hypothetical protein
MRLTLIPITLAAAAMCSSAVFAGCGTSSGNGCVKPNRIGGKTAEPKRFEPYHPDRLRTGSRPGFFDLGGGTEIRVGGRTRVEYQYTR